MRIELTSKFDRKFRAKTPTQREKVIRTLEKLAVDVRYSGLHTHKIKSAHQVFEAYVDRSHRVTFHYDHNAIIVRNCCEHDVIEDP